MRTYETVVILDDRRVHDEGVAYGDEFAAMLVAAGGEVIRKKALGRKQFAREMRKRKTGYYWDFIFKLAPDIAATLSDKYKLDERVLRLKCFLYDRPQDPYHLDDAPKEAPVIAKPILDEAPGKEGAEAEEA